MVKFKDDEERWRAEEDARVLKRAEELKMDKNRTKKAKALIQQELTALQRVAGVAAPKKAPAKKTPAKKATTKKQTKKK